MEALYTRLRAMQKLTLVLVLLVCATHRGLAATPVVPRGCSARESARLLKARDHAVLRGMAWMAGFLEDPQNFRALGTDAAAIFLGGRTARSATVRDLALPLARYEASRVAPRLLESSLAKRSDLFDSLWLLSEAEVLQIPPEPLLSRVRQRLTRLPTAEGLYGIDVAHLDGASEEDVYELLIDSYMLDKAALVYPELPLPTFRLADALRFLFLRRFVGYDEDPSQGHYQFQDHAYLATHVAYVLSDFSRLRLSPEDLGPLYGYLRTQFEPALRSGDPELIAEFVDVFRSLGFDEHNDGMVCRGTRFLLAMQHADGSWGWGAGDREGNPYDAIHGTWVVVDSLRERTFPEGTPYATFIKSLGPFTPRR